MRRPLRTCSLVYALAALYGVINAADAASALPRGVVATVNGAPITRSYIENRMWRETGLVTVDEAIKWEIIRSEASKRGIVVSPEELQTRMLEYKTAFLTAPGNTPQDWENLVQRLGKANIETRQRISLLAARIGDDVSAKTVLSTEEIARVDADLERVAHKVHARIILIGVGAEFGGRSDSDAKVRADEVVTKTASGAKWDDLSLAYSDDVSTRPHGGDLGFVTRQQLVKPLEDAMFSARPGTGLTTVVKLTNGYAVMEVLERKDAPPTAAERQKALDETLKRKKDLARDIATWFPQVEKGYRVQQVLPYER